MTPPPVCLTDGPVGGAGEDHPLLTPRQLTVRGHTATNIITVTGVITGKTPGTSGDIHYIVNVFLCNKMEKYKRVF